MRKQTSSIKQEPQTITTVTLRDALRALGLGPESSRADEAWCSETSPY